MKRKIMIIVLTTLILGSWGCGNRTSILQPSDLPNSAVTEKKIVELSPDWPKYDTANDIAKASTNIFTGKIKDVSAGRF